MLSDSDIKRFSTACVELYRPGLGKGNYAERSFAFLEKLVASDLIAFGSLNTAAAKLDIGFNHTVPQLDRAMEAFGALMKKYPLYCWDFSINDGKPFTRSDFFSRREFKQLDIFAEVYRMLGIDDHCAVFVPGTSGEVCFFGIERHKGADFSSEDRDLLALAQDHLGNARELAKSRDAVLQRGASPEPLHRAGLTVREAEVLAWLAEGKTNEEIAILLRLQLYTVKGYVKTIFQKIGAPNRLAAALWALRICRQDETRGMGSTSPFVTVPVITQSAS
ncbi:helix-turn-helix transcriptional regulator [Actomonas aquatica]|uniref:Helix-turn-helix transcriptional regulator n=1 Tax=Actomonas aquatica TaxID=2866162 RepID=A0ABZ1CF53_9BACT|nr:helix-turn-helix transcriptional regulator [Opitutus sp. WL0086]WRQ89990.1 helix-turn-helix transcriptional regulator [Opitutus sp. WL0086]